MEEYDASPQRYGPSVIGKYTKGIGQVEARFPTDDEDPVSFALTVVHRLVERMERLGFNETGQYSFDGQTLPIWNAIGRLDVGSESLIDRSKSMKSYVMDLFERYGDEHNIEGVDQYNACYGGQACGLCSVGWVQSDNWDGRYAVAVATDVAEVHSVALAFVGAACTATLYFPDAPLAVHSLRTTCIMNRLDFFKPVGWHSMAPVVDGKYSIDAYMSSVQNCYDGLKKKMNNQSLFDITDYNVFHTGGGYHVVKKAFERMLRTEDPKMKAEERDALNDTRLIPSVHLLKRIGPCHTVSSFLNIASVVMSQWDKALGKITVVFTYGSGCASTMYQLRHDDIAWHKPLSIWYLDFYREGNAIYQLPSTTIHDVYVEVWMKFDYKPIGREKFGLSVSTLSLDTYYLMEIDPWGRRFYHRGGYRGKPLGEQYHLEVDKKESRSMREMFGNLPDSDDEDDEAEAQTPSKEDRWKAIEYELVYGPDNPQDSMEILGESISKSNPNHKLVTVSLPESKKDKATAVLGDGSFHTYQIIGTWSKWKQAETMIAQPDGSYTFEVSLGANGWEKFYLVQDEDRSKKIYPAFEDSFRDQPCVGPHDGVDAKFWLLDGRQGKTLEVQDEGKPGQNYLVTFKWDMGSLKNLTWKRQEKSNPCISEGQYFLTASWTCWDCVELERVPGMDGTYSMEVTMTSLRLEFQILRNEDLNQRIYPDVDITQGEKGESGDRVLGVDGQGEGKNWEIEGTPGDVFRITFARCEDAYEQLKLTWGKVATVPPVEPPPRFFIVGPWLRCEKAAARLEMSSLELEGAAAYGYELEISRIPQEFQILEFNLPGRCIHPDKKECTQQQAHTTLKDDKGDGLLWSIGKANSDKARVGNKFSVRIDVVNGSYRVSWKKSVAG